MPVPTDFSSLDTNALNNSPPGTESAKGNIDNYLRQGFAFIKQLYNGSAAPAQATVASAATVDLGGQTSPNVIISGTTTITSFGTVAEGIERNVTFSGVLTLTHNATSLILPGGANITTAAGDCASFLSLGGGNWRCTTYSPATGYPTVSPSTYAAPACRGLFGTNNPTTPLTKYDLTADAVTLRNAAGVALTRYNTGTLTCDLGAAGSVANGRDQAGALSASSWVYLYFIWNGTTLATLASATAPASFNGSTLPTGYTHWCFATALRWDGSSNLLTCYVKGRTVTYDSAFRVLNGGSAASFTAVSCASYAPPIALLTKLIFTSEGNYGALGNYGSLNYRRTGSVSAAGTLGVGLKMLVDNVTHTISGTAEVPLSTLQQVDYKLAGAPVTGGAFIDVAGYTVPNGDA